MQPLVKRSTEPWLHFGAKVLGVHCCFVLLESLSILPHFDDHEMIRAANLCKRLATDDSMIFSRVLNVLLYVFCAVLCDRGASGKIDKLHDV